MALSPELKTADSPFRDLHIYYLRGRLQPAQCPDADDFLGNWEEDGYSFLFFGRPARERVEALVDADPGLDLLDETTMSYEQWQGGRISSMTVAGFTIVPPWEAPSTEGAHRVIILDPGLVFGNGLHPTTRDCLAAIEMACHPCAPHAAVDLGTGTGVLAVAMARCGIERVLAVDNNPLCARTAADNVRRNGLQDQVLVVQGRAEDHAAAADLMVANIHHEVMGRLLKVENLPSGRRVVLSGLLRSEARDVAARLSALGVEIHRQWTQDGIWHTFYGIHN